MRFNGRGWRLPVPACMVSTKMSINWDTFPRTTTSQKDREATFVEVDVNGCESIALKFIYPLAFPTVPPQQRNHPF
jgi:hypothetical protein